MEQINPTPQPGSPEQAPRLLPIGRLGWLLFAGALFCVLAGLAFVWLASAVMTSEFITFDDRIILGANRYWGPTLNQVMLFFTTMGDPLVLTFFVALATLALLRWGRWIDAGGVVVGSAGAGIINQLLKGIYQRVRPDLVDGPFHLTSYSFPSGHAMGSLACYGILAFVAIRLLRRRSYKLVVLLLTTLLVLCIGFSRVYFGVHFPTDIAGGFIAGTIWLVITIELTRIAEWYAARRARRLRGGQAA